MMLLSSFCSKESHQHAMFVFSPSTSENYKKKNTRIMPLSSQNLQPQLHEHRLNKTSLYLSVHPRKLQIEHNTYYASSVSKNTNTHTWLLRALKPKKTRSMSAPSLKSALPAPYVRFSFESVHLKDYKMTWKTFMLLFSPLLSNHKTSISNS
jgi:hypothetical protein